MSDAATSTALDANTRAPATLAEHLSGWLATTGEKTRTVAQLAVAETKLAAISASLMAFFAVLTAGCLLGAWGLAIAGTAYALLGLGVPLPAVLMGLAVAHVLAALVCWTTAKRLSRNLDFQHTRDQLNIGATSE